MPPAGLHIKLRCSSWPQLATIYKRDLSRGSMFLKAQNRPAIGTQVQIDLTLPSASTITLSGVITQHVDDASRGAGVEIRLAPIPASSVWLIETALSSELKVRNATATPPTGSPAVSQPIPTIPSIPEPDSSMSGLGDGAELASAEHELIVALTAEAESLRKLNPFLVLGVGYEVSDADVRAAFGELTKRYHPDRFARYQSVPLRQLAAEIFILIRDAYRRLSDEASRATVVAALGRAPAPRAVAAPRAATSGGPPPPPPGAGPPRQAAVPPPRPGAGQVRAVTEGGPPVSNATPPGGNRAIGGGTPRPAGSPVAIPTPPAATPAPPAPPAPPPGHHTERKPVLVNAPAGAAGPGAGDTLDGGAIEALLDAGRHDEALAAFKVMTKKNPADRSARAGIELCEGLRAMAGRDRLEAAQRFEAVLEIDPANERAARELADMRRQATNERKGLLSRLMGKKE